MVEVRESAVIDAPVEAVWRVLRDFNSHAAWHPAIAASEIEDGAPPDAVGAVRRFTLQDGGRLREQLLSLDDRARTLRYCLLEAPLPLNGYVATIRLRPVTGDDRTFWEWWSEFHPPARDRDALVALVRNDIYRAGFAGLARHLRGEMRSPATQQQPTAAPRPLRAAPVTYAPTGGMEAMAIIVDRYGGPEVLVPRTVRVPTPGPGEVQVRQHAIGVNFIDVYCRTGYFPLLTPPGTPGMEAVGEIAAVGAAVRDFAVGERVAYACPPVGAYAGLRNMAPDPLVRPPPEVSDEIVAASLLKGVTASFLLHEVHALRPGAQVVVHAAAGGVGQLLVQWAAALEARVVAVVSTSEKARVVRDLGAAEVVVTGGRVSGADLRDAVGGEGADVIFDAVGADSFDASLKALGPRGHLVSFGQASGDIGMRDIGALASKSVTLSRPNYGHYAGTPERMRTNAGRFFEALRRGIVKVAPPAVYPLEDAARAHADLETRRTTGALVLRP